MFVYVVGIFKPVLCL